MRPLQRIRQASVVFHQNSSWQDEFATMRQFTEFHLDWVLLSPTAPVSCIIYCISLNKCTGCGGRKRTPNFVGFQWNSLGGLLNTSTWVLKIWFRSVKQFLRYGKSVKSRRRIYSGRYTYLAKYSIQVEDWRSFQTRLSFETVFQTRDA